MISFRTIIPFYLEVELEHYINDIFSIKYKIELLFNSLFVCYPMEIIEKLPDDIVFYIYTNILKRYRFCKGTLIKLIELDNYAFLEKYICRRITHFYHLPSIHANEKKYRIDYRIPNVSEMYNRKDLYIDDDMVCMELIENENSLYYEISRFRLKRVDDLNKKKIPTIYHRGGLVDYDWEVVNYSYTI